jgi:hypothetical protein
MDALLTAGIMIPSRESLDLICPFCGSEHDIETDANGASYIYCKTHGERKNLTKVAPNTWSPQIDGILRLVSSAIRAKQPYIVSHQDRLWYMGILNSGVAAVNLYVARGTSWNDGHLVFGSALHGSVALTMCESPPLNLRDSAYFVPLASVLSIADNRVVLDVSTIPVPAAVSLHSPPHESGREEAGQDGTYVDPITNLIVETVRGKKFAHSADFTSVVARSQPYEFTPNPAKLVCFLWERWKACGPDATLLEIREAVGTTQANFRDILPSDHRAYNSLIVRPRRGRYRLEP